MGENDNKRRLSAILAADVAGYTRLVEQDTDGTVAAWQAARADIIDPAIAEYSGRIVKHTGDGFLAEFPTVQQAVTCAISMQNRLAGGPLDFRMGIDLGDIVDDGEDIHGEGVNIAARIEALADPGGVCISGGVFDQVRNRLDYGFDDLGEYEVKHVSTPVRVYRCAVDDVRPKDRWPGDLALPDKPSIAVLPFANISGETEQQYFADGMTEDIITLLSTVPDLFVIARNSTFAYKGRSFDVRDVAKDLGVRYVLEGSVRRAAQRIRVTAQFIDALSGIQIWAERYDRDLQDIFAVQDEVAQGIVRALQARLLIAEAHYMKRKAPDALDAWGNVVRAKTLLHSYRRQDIDDAEPFARQAISLDPNYEIGNAVLAHILAWRSYNGWAGDFKSMARESIRYSDEALRHGSNDPTVLADVGFAHWWLGRLPQGLPLLKRALELNPNGALNNAMYGYATAVFGETNKGVEYCEMAFRLSPRDPIEYMFWWLLGAARQFNEDFKGAKEAAERAIELNSASISAHLLLASVCVRLGELERAKALLEHVRAISDTAIPFIFRAWSEGTLWHIYTDPISPLKKALLTGFHSTAKHNATKAVSPSSETMRTI